MFGDNIIKNIFSSIFKNWVYKKTEKNWGYYRVLYSINPTIKIKELIVKPKHRLSMQYHDHRSEIWFVAKGLATVWTLEENKKLIGHFEKFSVINIAKQQWHQLENQQDTELSIIEIQYGESCVEQDIHRINL